MNQRKTTLTDLPFEILLKICSYLTPAQFARVLLVDRYLSGLKNDSFYFQEKSNQHYSYLIFKKGDYYSQFKIAYQLEYPKKYRALFAAVKEGDFKAIERAENISLEIVDLEDAQGITFLQYAQDKKHQPHHQAILDFFFGIAKNKLSPKPNQAEVPTDKEGRNLLHWAVLTNQSPTIIENLLKTEQYSVEAPTNHQFTPLMLAALGGFPELVACLIANGAKVDAQTLNGETSLLLAVERGHYDVVAILLQHNADFDLVLEQDSLYHSRFKVFSFDKPIHAAVKADRWDIVELLIQKGANIDSTGNWLKTPLMCAVEAGNVAITTALLTPPLNPETKLPIRAKANIDARTTTGATALFLAIEKKQLSTIEVLINEGADLTLGLTGNGTPHRINNLFKGDTPIHAAIKLGSFEIVKKLIAKDKNLVNCLAAADNTPLMYALIYRKDEIAVFLLAVGANVNAVSTSNTTALMIAVEEERENMVALLLKEGANPSIPIIANGVGNTPLHVAIRLGNLAIAKTLIKHNADLNARNSENKTPFELANKKQRDKLQILIWSQQAKINPNFSLKKVSFRYFFQSPIIHEQTFDAETLRPAVKALKKVLFAKTDKASLLPYKEIVNNSELGTLYRVK